MFFFVQLLQLLAEFPFIFLDCINIYQYISPKKWRKYGCLALEVEANNDEE